MNLIKILEDIENIDPKIIENNDSRRSAIKNLTSFGSKMAMAAIPIALSSIFTKAYAGPIISATDVFNYALTIEYLQYELYKQGTSTSVATTFAAQGQTAAEVAALSNIRDQQLAHINFLISSINALGGTPRTPLTYNSVATVSNFDYTDGGKFSTVFTNYDVFLGLAQVFEDLGVRAYKGQVVILAGQQVPLTAILNIQSVEARHAAHLRLMRRTRKVNLNQGSAPATLKPWVSGNTSSSAGSGPNDTGLGANVDPVYNGGTRENVTLQPTPNLGLIDVSGIGVIETNQTLSYTAAIECFDEVLTSTEVLAFITPFVPRGL